MKRQGMFIFSGKKIVPGHTAAPLPLYAHFMESLWPCIWYILICPFKTVMQILADEWISLVCFYCFFIIFPSLDKRCLIRLKTCRKIKIWNAWGYKRIGLWTVGIQISKVKNQLELLCTKKIRHNVFNLSSGGSVTWIVNFLSDILSSLANPTEYKQCESEDKSANEVFVTWPQNRSIICLCARRLLNLSTHPAKLGGHRTCGWGNIMFPNCHVTTELKSHVTFLGHIHDE